MSDFAEWRPCRVCGLPVALPKRTHDACLEMRKRAETMQPTVGRIVHYTLNQEDAEHINRRRVPLLDSASQAKNGAQVHVGNTAHEGDVLPMIVCRVWAEIGGVSAGINGQVFLDGNDTLWVTSRKESTGDTPGYWHWPPRNAESH